MFPITTKTAVTGNKLLAVPVTDGRYRSPYYKYFVDIDKTQPMRSNLRDGVGENVNVVSRIALCTVVKEAEFFSMFWP